MTKVASELRILLVDDRAEDLMALESILAAPDRTIVKATSGAEALRQLLLQDFALIVTDVMMPGMDGFELATLVRQRPRNAHVPMLFLTGIGDDVRSTCRAYAVGAVDFLTKPVDADILRAKVSVFVELFRKDLRIEEQTRELVQAERRHRRQELTRERLRNARRYKNLADAISHIVWTADKRGRVTHKNRRWFEYVGPERGDDSSRFWLDIAHDEDRDSCEERWKKALQEGSPFEAECRLRRADGTYRWHLCRAMPEKDDRGRVTGWLGTLTDLDDVVRARVGVEDSRRRLKFLAEVSATLTSSLDVVKGFHEFARHAVTSIADFCAVDVTDLDARTVLARFGMHSAMQDTESSTRIVDAVSAWASERAPLLLTVVTDDLLKNIARDEAQLAALRALAPTSVVVADVVSRGHAFGRIGLLSADGTRRYDADDLAMIIEIGRRAGEAVDNALLYRASERAIQARDEFLSVASHELRTPLSALLLQLGSLERAVSNGLAPTVPKKVSAALRHTHRLTKLVDNLLDVSRLTTKSLMLEVEPSDIGAIARDVVERFGEEAREAKCHLVLETKGDCKGTWDRLRMEQVLTNLLSNAIKYGRGTPIEFEVDGSSERVQVLMRDHGIGIAEEDQARIFDRFERAVSVRHYGGLGLGLYIVRQIVEAHGGTVSISSKRGDGTTFLVELPRDFATESGSRTVVSRAPDASNFT